MTFDSKTNLNLPIYEQAADWLIELREGEVDATTRERLDAWFRASPENIRAYLELSAIWEDGADADLDRTHSTEDVIARARDSSNVIALNASASDATSASRALKVPVALQPDTSRVGRGWPQRLFGRTRRSPTWAAALGVACVMGGAGLYLYSQRNLNYETGIGEQRFVKLVDGSTMELNSRSRVRIRYSSLERDVDLIEGQALFHVAKDSARPFIVHSGSTLVRAVGTQFDVYRKASGTTVTVVEGRVAVLSPIFRGEHEGSQSGSATPPEASTRAPMKGAQSRAPANTAPPRKPEGSVVLDAALLNTPNAIYLVAGEQITVSAQAQASPTHTDTAVATAWTQHELVFDSTSLIEVAQDFNRYNTRQLIINDAALRNFHITGVFSSADPASLLKFLRAQRDIVVEETDDGIHVSTK